MSCLILAQGNKHFQLWLLHSVSAVPAGTRNHSALSLGQKQKLLFPQYTEPSWRAQAPRNPKSAKQYTVSCLMSPASSCSCWWPLSSGQQGHLLPRGLRVRSTRPRKHQPVFTKVLFDLHSPKQDSPGMEKNPQLPADLVFFT